jgi:hypothetical protein
METLKTIFIIILVLLLIRLITRKLIEFPAWRGKLLADSSGLPNLLPEKHFWQIIKDAKANSGSHYETHCLVLTQYLSTLPEEDIIRFDRTFRVLLAKTYSYRLWEPAYALNGGCSDDGFEYFRTWLIGQGKNKFYWSVKYPRLLFFIAVKELMQDYEGLAYCACDAYELKTGKDFTQHDDIRYDDPGKIFKEGEAIARYPELALLAW